MVDAETRAAVAAVFVRLVLNFRLVAALVTLVWLRAVPATPAGPGVVLAIVAVGVISFAALKRWHRIGRWVAAHPGALAADLVLVLLVLSVLGADAPFVYVLLGTALLAGVLYGYVGATIFGVLLVVSHETVALRSGPASFTTMVTVPVLYPAATFASAAIGRLFAERSAAAQRAAEVETRMALARDLHDTLAKTVQGLRFSASALEAAAASGQLDRVRDHARAVRSATATADQEARALMRVWRAAPEPHGRLPTVLADAVHSCTTDGGPVLDVECPDDLPSLAGPAERELGLALREAVRNAVTHARASRVRIRIIHDARTGTVRVSVADDGVGWPAPSSLDASTLAGHYGLVGIRERVDRLGGTVELDASPLGGADLLLEVPVDHRVTAQRSAGVPG